MADPRRCGFCGNYCAAMNSSGPACRFFMHATEEKRELTHDEKRIANAVASKLLELADKWIARPTHLAVNKSQFLGVGEVLGLKLIRTGYIEKDHAALLLMTDDVVRYTDPKGDEQ